MERFEILFVCEEPIKSMPVWVCMCVDVCMFKVIHELCGPHPYPAVLARIIGPQGIGSSQAPHSFLLQ